MSITRTLLRVATVHALMDQTLAQDAVFDSIIDPLDARISSDGKRPVIVVYTDDHGGDLIGKGDYLQGDQLDLVIEIVVAGRVEVRLEDEDGEQPHYHLSIPNTDAGLEFTLDLIEAQAVQALTAGSSAWAEEWRILAPKIHQSASRRGASSENGTRFAARHLTLTCDLLIDPDRGAPLPDDSVWYRTLSLMAEDPATASMAKILLAELEGKAKADWRRVAARLGVNLSTVEAIGLGPVGADDPVLFEEGEVDP